MKRFIGMLLLLLWTGFLLPANGMDNTQKTFLTITAVGDCTLGTDERFGYENSFISVYEKQTPDYFFRRVAGIFQNDDLTIANFEGTLTESKDAADKRFTFKGPAVFGDLLNLAGIEAVNLANNHTYDYGEAGYADTLRNLSERGITYFGNPIVAIQEIKGVRVGLLGYVSFDTQNKSTIAKDIKALQADAVQLIIVSFHWGIERDYYPNDIQTEMGRYAVDCGADLVLGHHPHVLQGIENYKGKYIVYSLGNFCFGGNRNPDDKDTLIFQQQFTFQDGAIIGKPTINLIPASISSVKNRNNFQPIPLYGKEAERVLGRLLEYSEPFNIPDSLFRQRDKLFPLRAIRTSQRIKKN